MSCTTGNTATPTSSQNSSSGGSYADEAANILNDTSSSGSGQTISASSSSSSSLYYTEITSQAGAANTQSSSSSSSVGGGGSAGLGQSSLHNYVYQSYHPQSFHSTTIPVPPITVSAMSGGGGGGSASNVMSMSAGPIDEPEFKKVKLSHLHLNKQYLLGGADSSKQHLSRFSGATSSSAEGANNMYAVHKKLEERIGGILCCTVCLDLPRAIIYQVN